MPSEVGQSHEDKYNMKMLFTHTKSRVVVVKGSKKRLNEKLLFNRDRVSVSQDGKFWR